tara:strand:- start:1257 stop:2525 length:1269 start_codon:yes stop_codon:yes gene_type:complete
VENKELKYIIIFLKIKSMKILFGLPKKIKFCKSCVISNQRPSSIQEFHHDSQRTGAKYINFSKEGICDACNYNHEKKKIDWVKREHELEKLLDKYRKDNGDYDCLIPGSGGKDSAYQAHILKYKYGMNPLTITWSPLMYTDYGYKNYTNWCEVGGFDNLFFKQNGIVVKKLLKKSIENLLHPFQIFILGQKNFAPRIAKKFNINLIFYGENEAEYGNPIADNSKSLRDKSYFSYKNKNNLMIAGQKINDLLKDNSIRLSDIENYLPVSENTFDKFDLQIHYLGYYLKWTPQEVYYYASENTGFKPRPFRSQGTYSKYTSIDDKVDDLHWYTTFIKFGLGRASYEASQEIRNNHISREEAKMLVKKFDGEFPDIYFKEIMDFISMGYDEFETICNKFRSPHIWKRVGDNWKLRHNVNKTGIDD